MGELQYVELSGGTRIFFYVQTFISNGNTEMMLHRIVPPPCELDYLGGMPA